MKKTLCKISSIPVILDDIKKYDEFDMSRCTYFTIESDQPSKNWTLGLSSLNISVYLLGISGIIWKPLGDHYLFDSPELIEELFDSIEKNQELFVDINDIWLPNFMFEDLEHELSYVYRVDERLLVEAYYYRQDRISIKQFIDFCRKSEGGIVFSEEETAAFEQWKNRQIEEARRQYHENPEVQLEKIKP